MFKKLKSLRFKHLFLLIFLLALFLIVSTHLNNLSKYPIEKGFDSYGHLEYVNYIKQHQSIPLANQGWEFYQPPIYYVLVSLLPSQTYYKLISIVGIVLLATSIYLYFNHKTLLSPLLAALSLAIPVILSIAPSLSNEFLSGAIITVTLVYYLKNKPDLKSVKPQIVLGTLLGIALLTKATALVLITAIAIDLYIVSDFSLKKLCRFILVGVIVFAISGWFYLRNFYEFGNPLINPMDIPEFSFWQPPGYRDLSFFITIKGFRSLDLFTSHWYSILSGTYFSWFYDGHNNLLPVQNPSTNGILITLMSAPLFAFSSIAFFKKYPKRSSATVLKIFVTLSFIAYIIYNLKLPFYSTVKGHFLVSLIFPFIYFLWIFFSQHKKFIPAFSIYLVLYIILVSLHFYI